MEAIIKAPAEVEIFRYRAKRKVFDGEEVSIVEDKEESIIHKYKPLNIPKVNGYILLEKDRGLRNCYWLVTYNSDQAQDVESFEGYLMDPSEQDVIDQETKEVVKESTDSFRARIKNKHLESVIPDRTDLALSNPKYGKPGLKKRFA